MSWTAPRSWVVGEVLTAALLNTHLRDNLLVVDPTSGAEGQVLKVNASLDGYDFGGAGVALDFAGRMTGDPEFPHNGKSTTDIATSGAETWGAVGSGADREFAGRIVKLRRLDIDHAITLSDGGPWFFFIETVDWGASGSVSGNGPDGTTGTGASSSQNAGFARGGRAVSTVAAEGGAGGVIQVWCVKTETGTASRPITSSGGEGKRSGTGNAGGNVTVGGLGAMSIVHHSNPTATTSNQGEPWRGQIGISGAGGIPEFAAYLSFRTGQSLTSSDVAAGGGSGANGNGGSGIGGGAHVTASGDGSVGDLPTRVLTPTAIINLALLGCKGGGGGGAHVNTTGTNNAAGGGGGGAILRFVRTQTSAPTLTASGGAGVGPSGTFTGGAGVTFNVIVP